MCIVRLDRVEAAHSQAPRLRHLGGNPSSLSKGSARACAAAAAAAAPRAASTAASACSAAASSSVKHMAEV